jgi:AraC-like DNA-binding protein
VTVIVRRPGPPLDRLVEAITFQAGEQLHTSVEKILPSVATNLWVNLNRDEFRALDGCQVRSVPGAMLAGPRSSASVIEFEQGRAHIWVSFALGAAVSFGLPLAAAADELVPLESAWGSPGGYLREQLLSGHTPDDMLSAMEDALLKHLIGPLVPDPAMAAAAASLSRGQPVGEVADELGLLPRTMRRRFTAQVGLPPKRFARVQRLQRVVHSLDGCFDADWAAVAAIHGYSDQPHLSGEFRELADVTPREYLRSRIDGPNHLKVPTAPAEKGTNAEMSGAGGAAREPGEDGEGAG